jgi:CHRD domain
MGKRFAIVIGVAAFGVISIALAVGAVGGALAADNTVSATLSGKAVPGAGDDNGSGEAVLKLNKKKEKISFNISFKGIGKRVAAHVHKGGKKATDPEPKRGKKATDPEAEASSHTRTVVLFDEANVKSPVSGRAKWGSRNYTPDQKKRVISRIKNDPNDWYVNLHTPDFPGGAIRGQLKPGG